MCVRYTHEYVLYVRMCLPMFMCVRYTHEYVLYVRMCLPMFMCVRYTHEYVLYVRMCLPMFMCVRYTHEHRETHTVYFPLYIRTHAIVYVQHRSTVSSIYLLYMHIQCSGVWPILLNQMHMCTQILLLCSLQEGPYDIPADDQYGPGKGTLLYSKTDYDDIVDTPYEAPPSKEDKICDYLRRKDLFRVERDEIK